MEKRPRDLIRVYPDHETLSRAAAELFADRAEKAARGRGCFRVALSGGDTPRRAYQLLVRENGLRPIPWTQTHLFWGDERCVPPNDPRSNERMARELFLEQVPVPESQIHPIRCAASPAAAAREYESVLRRHLGPAGPSFDLVFLGLGEDGHTASLFPRHPALAERERWAVTVSPRDEGPWRVTMTIPVLNRARETVFLVSGERKADILQKVLHGSREPDRIPARLIRTQSGFPLWLVDRAACPRSLIP